MTDILKSFNALQNELTVAKTTLKGVDENIKRLIGRDPSEVISARFPTKRNSNNNQNEERARPRGNLNKNEDNRRFRNTRNARINEEIPLKRRTTNSGVSVFKRLSERPVNDEPPLKQFKGITSKVIVTPKEIPSRQERLDAQSKDVTSIARNRRMFGALLGTLQKFQQEETKLKTKEEKRAQVEKKIEEHEIQEKEEIKKARRELFISRKKKQAEIKMIELKMIRMEEYAAWEKSQEKRMNFIQTKAKPHIHFLPKKLNEANKTMLEESKKLIQETIDKKREQVQEELQQIEERGKRIFEQKKSQPLDEKIAEDRHEREENDDDDDEQDEDLNQERNETENELKMEIDESNWENIETIAGEKSENGVNEATVNPEELENLSQLEENIVSTTTTTTNDENVNSNELSAVVKETNVDVDE